MDKIVSKITSGLKGEIVIPSDKSISHRAIMFSSLAKGKTKVSNFSRGADCHSTLKVFSQLELSMNFYQSKN